MVKAPLRVFSTPFLGLVNMEHARQAPAAFGRFLNQAQTQNSSTISRRSFLA